MTELVEKLGQININSESAVLIAEKWITFKYWELALLAFIVVTLCVVVAMIVWGLAKDNKKAGGRGK